MQVGKCGLCGVGIFTSPLGCPPTVDHQRHSNVAGSHRGIILSIDTIHPTSACCSSCSRFSLVSSLVTFCDNLHGQMIPRVLLYKHSVSFTLLNVQPSRMYLFTYLTWLTVFCMTTEPFSQLSVPALQFFFCISVYEHLFAVFFVFSPAIFEIDLLFAYWLNDPFSCASWENGLASMRNTFDLGMFHGDFLV